MHEKLILVHSNFQAPFFLDHTLKIRIFDDYSVLDSLNRYFLKKKICSKIASVGDLLFLDIDCNVKEIEEMIQVNRGPAGRFAGSLEQAWRNYRTVRRELRIPRGKLILRTGFPLLMGIVNITPDSFHDGGAFFDRERAIERAFQLQEDGADIIDIGGQSTRPGSIPIKAEEEIERVIPVLMHLKGKLRIPVSIDTYYAKVARAALENGAEIINDTSALTMEKEEMLEVMKDFNVPVILMHYYKSLQPMETEPEYKDVLYEIAYWLAERADFLTSNMIDQERIVIDPGIGFGKLLENNVELFYKLDAFRSLGFPVLVGPSRKSFIGKINKETNSRDRLWGTISSCVLSLLKGAMIVRVHDVKEIRKALEVVTAILSGT